MPSEQAWWVAMGDSDLPSGGDLPLGPTRTQLPDALMRHMRASEANRGRGPEVCGARDGWCPCAREAGHAGKHQCRIEPSHMWP
jgi:hypothetical protein